MGALPEKLSASSHEPEAWLAAVVVPLFCHVTVKVTSQSDPLMTSVTVRSSLM